MKIIVDVGVGEAVEDELKRQGYDVIGVRRLNPAMPDPEILAIAVQDQRLVITMDKGFGELVYHSGLAHAGVLLLRMEDARSDEKVAVVRQIFMERAGELQDHFSVYQSGRLRIRT